MVKCVFCGKEESQHKGVHFITNDGNIQYFCSSKCKKNARSLKRDKRNIRWTEAFHVKRERAREREAEKKAKVSK